MIFQKLFYYADWRSMIFWENVINFIQKFYMNKQ